MELGIPATLLKKRLWHKCFPVNFVKLLRTPFLQNTSGRLLLNTYSRCSAGLQPGIWNFLVVSFSKNFFPFFFNLSLFFFFFFFFFDCNVCQARIYSLCFHFFLQKVRRPVLFSTSWLLLIVIDKFANRNRCGYCFRSFGKFPRERLQWSSQ